MGRTGPFIVLLLLMAGFLVVVDYLIDGMFKPRVNSDKYQSITEFMNLAENGQVVEVEIRDSILLWKGSDDVTYVIEVNPHVVNNLEFVSKLRDGGVKVTVRAPEAPSIWSYLLGMALVSLVVMVIFIAIMARALGGGGGHLSKLNEMLSTKAKKSMPGEKKITFDDVAGCDEAKEEVKEIVDFLKNPDKYKKLGAKIPKGVLMVGSPGCGKTLLAKAIAGEADVPFLSESGSGFVEMFVGVGASRARDLFNKAEEVAPCIVFIDEIDAVGKKRSGSVVSHDEREQTLNQILVRMDGFDESEKPIIVVGATNRPDLLDAALVRAGRFDRKIMIDLPDVKGREGILKIHTKGLKLDGDIDLAEIARNTTQFSGADLASLANEAALLAGRENKEMVSMEHFREARDRIIGGLKKPNHMIEKEKEIIAYHESGHTIVQKTLTNTDPVEKVTIVPRGMSLGATYGTPREDRRLYFKDYLQDLIAVLLSGRIAEEILGKGVTSGASNDFERATEIARRMITEFGMNDDLGPVCYSPRTETQIFLGGDFGAKNYSSDTHKKIDDKITEIIKQQYARAKEVLTAKRAILDKMAAALREKETLNSQEIDVIMGG